MPKRLPGAESEILQRITVRLMGENEQEDFDQTLAAKHYLGNARIVGEHLRYIAELDGQQVALCAFGASSRHLKGREKWIGWTPRQRARRLGLVVNNTRFLVLSERHRYPNLASRVLGLILRRLSEDWQARWGHPVLVVESFVDETLYRGTCYRACGFEAVGFTEGYRRASRDFYQEHGQPKQLYLRELVPGGRTVLRRGCLPSALEQYEEKITGPCPFRAGQLGSLLDRFRALPDGRSGHGLRHGQPFVLACAAVATLMGSSGYQAYEDTCKKFTQRQLKALGAKKDEEGTYAGPSDSTFFRVITQLDEALFEKVIGGWLLEQEVSVLKRLAVDGKVLRGSGRIDGKPLQLLSAVSHGLRLTLAQIAIEEKSNEIPALPLLLRSLPSIEGSLVTADAMHCQQESARVVTQELGGDFLFGLKGNQSGILEKAESLLAQQAFPP